MIAGDTAGVMFETKVTNVSKLSSGWQVTVHSGALINSKALIITAPVPQALELLRASDIAIDSEILLTIERLTFRRCIAVVMRELDSFAASKKYSWPTLWKDPSVELDGIFDQKRKGISNSQNIVVVHTSKSLTEQLWSMEPDLIKRSVEQVVNPIVSSEQEKVQWEAIHLHKWRYSEPESIHPEKCLLIDVDGPLVLAGDAFGRSSVDGAFSSGHAAATLLLDKISNVIPLRDSP
jgi:predicted NAD/FAD-dependent oxidoreductase